jgi:hypothetical protein
MDIFKQLAEGVQNTEVTYTVEREGASIEVNGSVIIKKGGLTRTKSYWARTYVYSEGVVKIDEWEGDWEETTFNGIKIDSFDAFKKGFEDHGMRSVAASLEITDEEVSAVIYQAVANHKSYKAVYKKARLFELFSPEEARAHFFILFKEGKYVPHHRKVEYGWNVEKVDLSIEEVIELEKN